MHVRCDDFDRDNMTTEMRRPFVDDYVDDEKELQSEPREQRLLLDILVKIGVAQKHWQKFLDEEIGVYDFFLLRRDDLIELQLPIAVRNRIIAFHEHYRQTM
jgi:hypothetical protein